MDQSDDITEVKEILTKLELLAHNVLTDRQEIITLDRRRNANREALRTLTKSLDKHASAQSSTSGTVEGSKPITHSSDSGPNCWTCIGDMFLRIPKTVLIDSVNQGMFVLP